MYLLLSHISSFIFCCITLITTRKVFNRSQILERMQNLAFYKAKYESKNRRWLTNEKRDRSLFFRCKVYLSFLKKTGIESEIFADKTSATSSRVHGAK